jgi:uncharacterized protein YcfL
MHFVLPLIRLRPSPRLLRAAAAAVGLALCAGCTTAPEAAHPAETTKYTLENTDRFALVDGATGFAVSCTGLMEHPLADGRTEIVANLKNRDRKGLTVQASCMFRDTMGLPTEETPWQAVTLPEGATVAVRFTATGSTAKNYTVRVRDSR